MTKQTLSVLILGILSSVVATLLLNFIFNQNVQETKLAAYLLLGILLFGLILILYNPLKNLLNNYKYLKNINVYWWDLNKESPKNNITDFQKHFSPKIDNADKRIIAKLNTGKLFFQLFEINFINNPQIRHLNSFELIFTVPLKKIYSPDETGKYIETMNNFYSKKEVISNGRVINYYKLEEKRSLYNYIIIDDYCLFSAGGLMLDIDLNKCNPQVSKIIERLNEHVLESSERIKPSVNKKRL